MDFAVKLMTFIIMNSATASASLYATGRLSRGGFLEGALTAVVLFFAQVTIIGALLGFTGAISAGGFLVASILMSVVVIFAARRVTARAYVPLKFPEIPWRPLPVGFFLPLRAWR